MSNERLQDVVFIGIGVAGLLLSRHATGGFGAFAHRHGANVSFSFAAFFLVRRFRPPGGDRAWPTAVYALAAVCTQEVLQGLGLYPGTFDPRDVLFNAVGLLAALVVHHLVPAPSPSTP